MPVGYVGQTHGGGGLVDVLAARAGGAVHVHLDLVGADLHLAVVLGDLGHDLHGGEAGVAAAGGVEAGRRAPGGGRRFSLLR